jgi:hypothetical protein
MGDWRIADSDQVGRNEREEGTGNGKHKGKLSLLTPTLESTSAYTLASASP